MRPATPAAPSASALVLPLLLSIALAPGCGASPAEKVLLPDPWLRYADVAPDTVAYLLILEVEDRRAAREGDEALLVEAASSAHPGIRRAAVRALGRLERPDLIPVLLPHLDDEDPQVRAEAANALAQAAATAAAEQVAELGARLRERDPRGFLARPLGRLPLAGERGLREAEAGILAALEEDLGDADPGGLADAARGAYLLYRAADAEGLSPSRELPARLARLAEDGWARRAAAAALVVAEPPDPGILTSLLADPEPEVRRWAASALSALPDGAPRDALILDALSDPEPRVRVEAVRAYAGTPRAREGCAPLLEAARDESDHVALAALDALALPCPEADVVGEALAGWAGELPAAGDLPPGTHQGWHRAARALGALARTSPARAVPLLPAHAGHRNPFVRAHAARTAAQLEDEAALRSLALDLDPNVREAAVSGLVPLLGLAGASDVLLAQLSLDDPQLLLTAARLLEGAEPGAATPDLAEGLLSALERLTALRAPTTRDTRVALLRRVGELGGPGLAPPRPGTPRSEARLEPFLRDIDPVVAEEAARILGTWTGLEPTPAPEGLPDLLLPTLAELRRMESLGVEVEMEHGGRFLLRLLPFEAPTNAARFVRMAEDGVLDGLTLHRVATNFVVQGGSPGANEYAGHGAYTRDERGRIGHWRGTVGVSTRGRDTGDGQIFVNLVDNHRLDHAYTVFAVVIEGMDVVDRIQEGAVMRAVRTRPTPP